MSDLKFTDAQWAILQPLMPPRAQVGRPRADDRRTLEAILFVLKTGCRWRDLPREHGSPVTAWRRLRRWEEEGVWERLWRTVLSVLDARRKIDWEIAFLDGSFVPAKKGVMRLG
jgi:transposase